MFFNAKIVVLFYNSKIFSIFQKCNQFTEAGFRYFAVSLLWHFESNLQIPWFCILPVKRLEMKKQKELGAGGKMAKQRNSETAVRESVILVN